MPHGKRESNASVSPMKSMWSTKSLTRLPSQRRTWTEIHVVQDKPVTKTQVAAAVYNWSVWLLVSTLVLSQFLGVFWSKSSTYEHAFYGRSPERGLYNIPGGNDEPYSDRSILCTRQGRNYVPISVNDAIAFGGAKVVDTIGTSRSGYRLVKRSRLTMIAEAEDAYINMCTQISDTLDSIFDKCTQLGYNLARQDLQIVDGIESTTTYRIPHVLPVVIMPFWDNCMDARFAVPGIDGSACMFRVTGKYTNPLLSAPLLAAVNRTVREAKTEELLQRPGGT